MELLKARFAGVVGKPPEFNGLSRSAVAQHLDRTLWSIAHIFQRQGINVIGALLKQQEALNTSVVPKEAERMDIQIFPTREIHNIFLPEKCERMGCRLDRKPFAAVVATVQSLLDKTGEGKNSVLVLNRFGKSETEGGGYATILETALEKDIPVIIGVSNSHSRRGGHDFRIAWERYIEGTSGVALEESVDNVIKWSVANHILAPQ